ncbi:MAG: RsiV family protein [Paludibacteraceae bacterium]|nr:DUF3298 domain-containing protein [Paludibacteraceae bacterium]MCR5570470.1 RsiV family protein [Paludibacteraceae bacterium]
MGKYTFIVFIALLGMACSGSKDDGTNSVKFDTFKKDTVYNLSSSADSPSLKVHVVAELPVSCQNRDVLVQMQKLVSNTVIGNDTAASTPTSTLELYVQKCVNDYKSLEKEYTLLKDTMTEGNIVPNSFNWKINLNGAVTFVDKGILCYQAETQSYTDGDHLSSFIRSYNIIVKEGRVIGLNDIFSDGYEDVITSSIINKLKEQCKCDNLSSFGFFDEDEICPSQNFSIDNDGITFIYNPGDIALNSLGIIKVQLSYQELAVVLNPETIIKDFIKD